MVFKFGIFIDIHVADFNEFDDSNRTIRQWDPNNQLYVGRFEKQGFALNLYGFVL